MSASSSSIKPTHFTVANGKMVVATEHWYNPHMHALGCHLNRGPLFTSYFMAMMPSSLLPISPTIGFRDLTLMPPNIHVFHRGEHDGPEPLQAPKRPFS